MWMDGCASRTCSVCIVVGISQSLKITYINYGCWAQKCYIHLLPAEECSYPMPYCSLGIEILLQVGKSPSKDAYWSSAVQPWLAPTGALGKSEVRRTIPPVTADELSRPLCDGILPVYCRLRFETTCERRRY